MQEVPVFEPMIAMGQHGVCRRPRVSNPADKSRAKEKAQPSKH